MGGRDDYFAVEMRITGSLSLVASAGILLTYYLFKELRTRRYIKLIVCVSLCCFVQSIAVLIGPSLETGSVACWFQGLVLNYCTLACVLWVLIIAYELYTVILSSNIVAWPVANYQKYCWVFPLITTLLPLTTNTYGNNAGGGVVCFIADRSDSPKWGKTFWIIASFYFWLWLGILFICYCFIKIYQYRSKQPLNNVNTNTSRFNVLAIYPIILISCWIFPTFDRMWYAIPSNGEGGNYTGHSVLNTMSNTLPNCLGFLLAMALFFTSEEVRRYWSTILMKVLFASNNDDEGDNVLLAERNSIYNVADQNPNNNMSSSNRKRDSKRSDDTTVVHHTPSLENDEDPDDADSFRPSRISSRLSRFFVPTFGNQSMTSTGNASISLSAYPTSNHDMEQGIETKNPI